jgi:hypothetical protein
VEIKVLTNDLQMRVVVEAFVCLFCASHSCLTELGGLCGLASGSEMHVPYSLLYTNKGDIASCLHSVHWIVPKI